MILIPDSISKTISFLRLPLIIGVVFIHSDMVSTVSMPILEYLIKIFTKSLPAFCVPLFYLFAGYLFFAKTPKLTASIYVRLLKKRFITLAIPYLVWNTFVIIFFLLMHRYFPAYINPDFENVATFSPMQLLNCYWSGSGGFPISYQFWFIRDLMVVMIFSPFIYFLVKKGYWGVTLLTILYFWNGIPYVTALFYFSVGAFFGLQKIDFVEISKKRYFPLVVLSFILLFCMIMWDVPYYIIQFYIISSSFAVIGCVSKWFIYHPIPKMLSNSSFFIFCFHAIPLFLMITLSEKVLMGKPEFFWILDYFFNPIIISGFAYGIYYLLKKTYPIILFPLSGGR